ncbi:NPCBM/NEW2 domain-containing protein [uncultured Rubinisphaera sp.]|uniref:NPCBM/NEW2 domain-containing protein n=1 Tax=uncultured Rubinisphaera sp. TaxID=1678686 RepID=UPI0030DADEE0
MNNRSLSLLNFVLIFSATCCYETHAIAASKGTNSESSFRWSSVSTPAQKVTYIDQKIKSYQKGGQISDKTVRVVYFYTKDRGPCKNYQERWNRILSVVEDYFNSEFKRYQLEGISLAMEKEGSNYKLHLVESKQPFEHYLTETPRRIRKEVDSAMLARGIDPDQECFLIVNTLSNVEGNKIDAGGKAVGIGPSQLFGGCHVTDSELLDVKFKSLEPIQFRNISKMQEGYKQETLERYHRRAVGCVIHELSHALGIRHNTQNREETSFGKSIMGGGGMYSFKGYLLKPDTPRAIFVCGDIVRLMTHPICSGSIKQREDFPITEFFNLDCDYRSNRIYVTGHVRADIEPIAVIAYNDYSGIEDNYDATSFLSVVNDNHEFRFEIDDIRNGDFELRLFAIHANGARSELRPLHYRTNDNEPDLRVARVYFELSPFLDALKNKDLKSARKIQDMLVQEPSKRIARQLLDRELPLLEPSQFSGRSDEIALTDFKPKIAEVGFGNPVYDRRPGDNPLLESGGNLYETGIYAHSPSRYVFRLNGKWKKFKGYIGLASGKSGSVEFEIKTDGKSVARSPVIKQNVVMPYDVDVEGIRELELITYPTDDGGSSDHGFWLEPKLCK